MASDFDELSRKAEEKVANTLKKTAALTSGTFRGVSSTLPKWLKIALIVVGIFVALAVLGNLGEEEYY